jgi:hypothetical protein
MDAITIAANLTAFLAPVLPYLIKAGEKAAEAVGERFGAGVWEKATEIWGRLRPKLDESAAAKEAVEEVAKNPDDEDARAALRLQLKKILAADSAVADELARLLKSAEAGVGMHAQVVGSGAIAQGAGSVAAGEGGSATGGSVSGGIHISGRRDTKR